MHTKARDVLNDLNTRGITCGVEGSDLVVFPSSALDEEIRRSIRLHKAELVRLLGVEKALSRWDAATWEEMRKLGQSLGREVDTGEPWGRGLLWGVTANGAVVHFGHVLVTFELTAISTPN